MSGWAATGPQGPKPMGQGVVREGKQHHLDCRKHSANVPCVSVDRKGLNWACFMHASAALSALTSSQIGDLPSALLAIMIGR